MSEIITTNVDPRHTRRGQCQKCRNEGKECAEYEIIVGERRSNCLYCGHHCTDHDDLGPEILVISERTTPSAAPAQPANSGTHFALTPSTSDLQEMPIIELNTSLTVEQFLDSVQRNSASTSKANKEVQGLLTDDIPMPANLPRNLENIFVAKAAPPDENSINEMICNIVNKLVDSGFDRPTDEVIGKAARKASKTFSPLKVKGDVKCVGLGIKNRRRYRTLNSVASKKKRTGHHMQMLTVESIMEQMTEDWEKNQRSPPTMMMYMNQLRNRRMRSVRNQAAGDHLRRYPALRLPHVLTNEFEQLTKVSVQTMMSNWISILPKLVEEMCGELLFDKTPDDNTDSLTIKVLQNLHRVKLWSKKTRGNSGDWDGEKKRLILEMFPAGTVVSEVWARNREPPRLLGLENGDGGKPSFMCHVDTVPLFSVDDPFTAVFLLIAAFYAFHIGRTPQAKLPLCLLASALIGLKNVISKVSNNSKFISYLRKIGIDV